MKKAMQKAQQKAASDPSAPVPEPIVEVPVGPAPLKSWQRTPKQLIHQYCQREKRPKPVFKDAAAAKGLHRCRLILPDGKKQEKDMMFLSEEGFPSQLEAQHYSALLALQHMRDNIPLERLLPDPYKDAWLSFGSANPVVSMANKYVTENERQQEQETRRLEQAEKERNREKHKRKRELPPINMTEEVRRSIESALQSAKQARCQNISPSSRFSFHAHTIESLPSSEVQILQNIVVTLQRMGFEEEDCWKAVEHCHRTVSAGSAEGVSGPVELSVSAALDWLLIELPESRLPKKFDPRGTQFEIKVFNGSSNQERIDSESKKKPQGASNIQIVDSALDSSHLMKWVDGSINGSIQQTLSAKERELYRFGFELASIRSAIGSGSDSTVDDLLWTKLYTDSVWNPIVSSSGIQFGIPSEADIHESISQIEDEQIVLESILAEDFINQCLENGLWIVNIKVSLSSGEEHLLTLHVRIDSAQHPYPTIVPPRVLISSETLSPSFSLFLSKRLLSTSLNRVGSPIIHELSQWLQDEFQNLVQEYVKLCIETESNLSEVESSAPLSPSSSVSSLSTDTSLSRHAKSSRTYRAKRDEQSSRETASTDSARLSRLSTELLHSETTRINKVKSSPSAVDRQKRTLPAFSKRDSILDLIQNNQVVLIQGDTGCGKTTQVPQYILETWLLAGQGGDCNIICTQPRRISAIGVAERVAFERSEKVGDIIGYQVRLKSMLSWRSRISFCTTGILLRRLINDPMLLSCSHIIIDEVHERSVEMDFLLAILKSILPRRPDLKVILMSATVDAALFTNYFRGCPTITIPGFTFPVQEYYLDDINRLIGGATSADLAMDEEDDSLLNQILEEAKKDDDEDEEDATPVTKRPKPPKPATTSAPSVDIELVVSVIQHIQSSMEPGGILVFLPGLEDIVRLKSRLGSESTLWVLPLHASLPTEEQKRVFDVAPRGRRKVVLSTNIAETSITVEDVVFVIDTSLVKEMRFDPVKRMSGLVTTWTSQASCRQRRGRAGRVRPGHCFRLLFKSQFNSLLKDTPPEIHRIRIEQLLLQIKRMHPGKRLNEFVASFIEPPSSESIHAGVKSLLEVGALDTSEILTPLGSHLSALPVDIHLGKMLIYASLLRCLEPVLTVAAMLSCPSPFFAPMSQREEANKAKQSLAWGRPDHLTMVRAYNEWKAAKKKGTSVEMEFCRTMFLSKSRLEQISDVRKQFRDELRELGFEVEDRPDALCNQNSNSVKVILAAVCAGLYPRVVRIRTPDRKYHKIASGATLPTEFKPNEIKIYTEDDGRVFMHPSSVNFVHGEFDSPWLVFSEKVQTSKVFIRDSSMVAAYALLLLCGQLSVQHTEQCVTVDNWIKFQANPRVGVLAKQIRAEVDILLQSKIMDPSIDISSSSVIQCMKRLIEHDGYQ
eukprot:GILJ01013424.1.p1 GENE.GILJ01013424.1~~GILJ01013424.1.p1  ORF type:complete len:1443 (+),score=258.53 GILJ01013424.1:102-4331(+)